MMKKYSLFLGSFLLPFFSLLILWSILGVVPFGNHNLLVSDLGTQYLPFLSAFKRFFENGNDLFYSFSNTIGGTTLPLSAYYLISPFNVLALFFTYDQLPIAIVWIITMKIALIGTAMFYYLSKTYSTVSLETLIFSTSYSFCGFIVVYCLNFMWLDALILLPLITLGLQQLWEKQAYWLYVVTLFLAIVTNFYLGYMLCIYAVLYSVYSFSKQNKQTGILWFKEFFKASKLFFITSILTGISTSFLLVPAIEGMLQTNKTAFKLVDFMPKSNFGLAFFSQFGIGTVNFDIRLEHLPTVFSGTFVILCLLTFFQLSSISKREKWLAFWLLFSIFISFWIETFDVIWHMLQSPAGFPYRNAFIFSFLLIKFAYEAFLKLKAGNTMSILIPSLFSLLLLIGYSFLYFSNREYILSWNYLLISLGFIWILYGLFSRIQKVHYAKILLISFMLIITCFELGGNFFISLKDVPFGNQKQFVQTYQKQQRLLQSLPNKQHNLFRLTQVLDSDESGYNEKNNGYNNAILYGYAGVSSYSSTLNANTQDFLNALGLYRKNDRRIAYVDHSKVVNFMLNVAYSFSPKEKAPDKTIVQQNKEAIGMGFLTSSIAQSMKFSKASPLENQESILQSISPNKKMYFQKINSMKNTNTSHKSYKVTLKTSASGDLYLHIPTINWEQVTNFTVNGKKISPPVYIATNQLYNLGYFTSGESVSLVITTPEELQTNEWDLRTLNQKVFQELVQQEKKQAIHLRKNKKRELHGNITVTDTDKNLLYLSIPYDKNWQIQIDRKKVKAIPIYGNMTGIYLSKGKHTLKISYKPNSFYVGCLISFFVFIGVLFYHLIKHKKKRSNKV